MNLKRTKKPKQTQLTVVSKHFALEAFKQLEEHEGRAQLEAFAISEKKMSIASQLQLLSKKKKNKVGACLSFLDVFTADNEFLPLDIDSTVSI